MELPGPSVPSQGLLPVIVLPQFIALLSPLAGALLRRNLNDTTGRLFCPTDYDWDDSEYVSDLSQAFWFDLTFLSSKITLKAS